MEILALKKAVSLLVEANNILGGELSIFIEEKEKIISNYNKNKRVIINATATEIGFVKSSFKKVVSAYVAKKNGFKGMNFDPNTQKYNDHKKNKGYCDCLYCIQLAKKGKEIKRLVIKECDSIKIPKWIIDSKIMLTRRVLSGFRNPLEIEQNNLLNIELIKLYESNRKRITESKKAKRYIYL